MQPSLAPRGKELSILYCLKSHFTQGATGAVGAIHTRKPLAGGSISDGRFVTPAIHVAVLSVLRLDSATYASESLDTVRIRLPKILATEKTAAVCMSAIVLNCVKACGAL